MFHRTYLTLPKVHLEVKMQILLEVFLEVNNHNKVLQFLEVKSPEESLANRLHQTRARPVFLEAKQPRRSLNPQFLEVQLEVQTCLEVNKKGLSGLLLNLKIRYLEVQVPPLHQVLLANLQHLEIKLNSLKILYLAEVRLLLLLDLLNNLRILRFLVEVLHLAKVQFLDSSRRPLRPLMYLEAKLSLKIQPPFLAEVNKVQLLDSNRPEVNPYLVMQTKVRPQVLANLQPSDNPPVQPLPVAPYLVIPDKLQWGNQRQVLLQAFLANHRQIQLHLQCSVNLNQRQVHLLDNLPITRLPQVFLDNRRPQPLEGLKPHLELDNLQQLLQRRLRCLVNLRQ